MLRSGQLLVIGVCAALLLAGCGSSSNSSVSEIGTSGAAGSTGSSGPGNPIGGGGGGSGSSDMVVATPSVSTVADVVGTHRTVSITFTSSDRQPITGFGISGNMTMLPAGWSGPASFACATVSTGSGCVLNLTYAPTTAGNGTLTLDYVFVANSGVPNTTGSFSLPYVATPADNVLAAASPTGQITAVAGSGTQSVAVTFTTDDGTVATGLTLTTNLSTLPAGWSAASSSFSCPTVSTGNGCQLALTFAPATVAASGTLVLNYAYVNDAGAAKTGSLNLAYTATTDDSVVATPSPSAPINAVVGAAGAPVTVTFTTNDGRVATGLTLTTNLSTLPAGWSAGSSNFACATVSMGNGCQLQLTFTPTSSSASGTLPLNYAYTNNAGTAETGSLNLAYAAMTNDSVVGTAFPTGQINAVVGAAGVPVTVTFTTNDGLPASALQLTSSLSALPAGWSSNVTTFSCAGVSTGNGCQLALTYAPTSIVAASGTLMLAYSYINDVGVNRTGTVSINYQSTTSDSILGTASPNPVSVAASASEAVTVTFTTNDGNPASALTVTGGLGNLPSGWTGPGTFGCQSVSTGNACTLSLTYAPTAVTNGPPPLALTYSYDDDSGASKTGTVSISYAATPLPHLYVADFDTSVLYCSVAGDGSLTACPSTGGGSGIVGAAGIAFYGASFAYVADYFGNAVYLCNVAADGSFSSCNTAGGGFQFNTPWQIAVEGTTLYVTLLGGTGGVDACSIAVDGTLYNCGAASVSGTGAPGTAGIAVGARWAYVGVGPTTVELCAVSAQGALSSCAATATNSVFNNLDGITLSGGYAYVADEGGAGVSVCPVDATFGTLSACVFSPIANSDPDDVAFDGTHAYVSDFASGAMNICTVGANGALTNCAPTQVTAPNPFPPANQIAIH